jgi:hypothetical protein
MGAGFVMNTPPGSGRHTVMAWSKSLLPIVLMLAVTELTSHVSLRIPTPGVSGQVYPGDVEAAG